MNKYPAICFVVGHDYKFVYPSDIMYVQSEGSYSNIYLQKDQKLTVSKNLKELESTLPKDIFVRIHHSILLNLIYVDIYHHDSTQEIELTNGVKLPLSRRKKSSFLNRFIKI